MVKLLVASATLDVHYNDKVFRCAPRDCTVVSKRLEETASNELVNTDSS